MKPMLGGFYSFSSRLELLRHSHLYWTCRWPMVDYAKPYFNQSHKSSRDREIAHQVKMLANKPDEFGFISRNYTHTVIKY